MGKTSQIFSILLTLMMLGISAGQSKAADLTVSATIPSWGFCSFRDAGYSLEFGSLDPGNPVDVDSQVDASFRCFGWGNVTFYIGHDAGLYGAGPNSLQMKHASQDLYLAYDLSLNPNSGTLPTFFFSTGWQDLTITGSIKGADYATAVSGNYSDTVILTITP